MPTKINKILPVALFVLLFVTVSQASVTYQGQSTGYVYGSSSVSITPPYNTSGQVMVAMFNVLNETDIEDAEFINPLVLSSPSGWTKIVDNGFYGLGEYRAAWYRIATGSPSSISWSFDVPLRGQVSILVYSGVDNTYPVNSYSFKNDWLLSSTHTTNAVTTDYANCLILAGWFSADTGISFYDPSSPENSRINFAGISMQAQRPMVIADEIQSAAGSSGTKTATTNSNSYCQSIMIALKPTS